MTWINRTHIFNPSRHGSMWTHGMMPKASVLSESNAVVEVLFGRRDMKNRSHVHSLVFDVGSMTILDISNHSLLYPGVVGAFDDAGVSPGSLLMLNGVQHLYFTGWNLTQGVPFNNSIGVARRTELGFERLGNGPILTRSLLEPFSVASPFVAPYGDGFIMWYSSMDEWVVSANEIQHRYDIKMAFSKDALNWSSSGSRAVTYEDPTEYAFGCNFVMSSNEGYKMWYPYRGVNYRIGFATSRDGLKWVRHDKSQFAMDPNPFSSWESSMVCYPSIFALGDTWFMVYNGNGYGATGFGLAEFSGEMVPA